jgi:hypothetical protein
MADALYFAYGSNLLRERLLARCPSLVFEGRGVLADHGLRFDKISTDTSGKGNFEAAAGEVVHGVLWRIPRTDLDRLDGHEGVGNGYQQCVVPVEAESGDVEQSICYQATRREPGLRPFDWYLALVIAGAMQQQLPDDYIKRIRATPFRVDGDANRKGRLAAIDALTGAGMMDVLLAL